MFSLYKNINPVIRFLALSNIVTVAAIGLFGPLFAIYLTQKIQTQNIFEVIGLAASIFLLTRSLSQIPIAYLIDKIPGEIDDFWFLFAGNVTYVIVPILYLFVSEP